MRNLKRVLSLSLASIMLLGMMVIGSSAASDYPDVDYDNDNVEAIEVLQAINVMTGYAEDGGFHPGDEVTRGQMARIMSALMDLDYDYYIGANPFTDMVGHWAEAYAAACYANGIIAGRTTTTYDPEATVTAVEAAAMLMRALGYFQNKDVDYPDGFVISTIKQAGKINLFDRVDAKTDEPMTRNDVAQLILNTLQSGMVEPDSSSRVDITVGDAQVSLGSTNYVYVVARDNAVGQAINETKAEYGNSSAGLTGYILDLGEQLYNGKLKLRKNEIDVFGRPSRQWEFDGEKIGTYAKTELLAEEYVGEVTGKDLYDLLGSTTLEEYDVYVRIDGLYTDAAGAQTALGDAWFNAVDMNKNNKAKVGATGTGTLTEVYVDNEKDDVYVAVINTYLAIADNDYNSKREEVSLSVYSIDKATGLNNEYVKLSKDGKNPEAFDLTIDDFPSIVDIAKDDPLLVTVAEGEIQTIQPAEVLEAVTISSFKYKDNVVADGTKYSYTTTAGYKYDDDINTSYTGTTATNLKDRTYNIYLDVYDNLIGIKEVEAVKNYVFITGIDLNGSNRANQTADASAIFLDGTMGSIKVNMTKSELRTYDSTNDDYNAVLNTWCTYTVSGDVYTVKEVSDVGVTTIGNAGEYAMTPDDTGEKLAQFNQKSPDGTMTIDSKNYRMYGGGAQGKAYYNVYGDVDSVYLTVKLGELVKGGGADTNFGIIKDVVSVSTGIENTNLTVWDNDTAKSKADEDSSGTPGAVPMTASGIYGLYNDKGLIVAAVVIGEDAGTAKDLVYVHSSGLEQESYDGEAVDGLWTWTRKVVRDGEEVLLTEVGDDYNTESSLYRMDRYKWYQIRTNADGNVIEALEARKALTGDTSAYVTEYDEINDVVEISSMKTVLYLTDDGPIFVKKNGKTVTADGNGFTTDLEIKGTRTLAVTGEEGSGIWFRDDVHVVLQYWNRNKQEQDIMVGDGVSDLKRMVDIVNDNNDNGRDSAYFLSALIEDGRATTIVIYDSFNDYNRPGGEVVATTDNSAKWNDDRDGIIYTIPANSSNRTPTKEEILNDILRDMKWDWNPGYGGDVFIGPDKDGNYEITHNGITYPVEINKLTSSDPGTDDPGTDDPGTDDPGTDTPGTGNDTKTYVNVDWYKGDDNEGADYYVYNAESGERIVDLETIAVGDEIELDPAEALMVVDKDGEVLAAAGESYEVEGDFYVATAPSSSGQYVWFDPADWSVFFPYAGWYEMTRGSKGYEFTPLYVRAEAEAEVEKLSVSGTPRIALARTGEDGLDEDGNVKTEDGLLTTMEAVLAALENDYTVKAVIPYGEDGERTIVWYITGVPGTEDYTLSFDLPDYDGPASGIGKEIVAAIKETSGKLDPTECEMSIDEEDTTGGGEENPGEEEPGDDDDTVTIATDPRTLPVQVTVNNSNINKNTIDVISVYFGNVPNTLSPAAKKEITADDIANALTAYGIPTQAENVNIAEQTATADYGEEITWSKDLISADGVVTQGATDVTQVWKVTYPDGVVYLPSTAKGDALVVTLTDKSIKSVIKSSKGYNTSVSTKDGTDVLLASSNKLTLKAPTADVTWVQELVVTASESPDAKGAWKSGVLTVTDQTTATQTLKYKGYVTGPGEKTPVEVTGNGILTVAKGAKITLIPDTPDAKSTVVEGQILTVKVNGEVVATSEVSADKKTGQIEFTIPGAASAATTADIGKNVQIDYEISDAPEDPANEVEVRLNGELVTKGADGLYILEGVQPGMTIVVEKADGSLVNTKTLTDVVYASGSVSKANTAVANQNEYIQKTNPTATYKYNTADALEQVSTDKGPKKVNLWTAWYVTPSIAVNGSKDWSASRQLASGVTVPALSSASADAIGTTGAYIKATGSEKIYIQANVPGAQLWWTDKKVVLGEPVDGTAAGSDVASSQIGGIWEVTVDRNINKTDIAAAYTVGAYTVGGTNTLMAVWGTKSTDVLSVGKPVGVTVAKTNKLGTPVDSKAIVAIGSGSESGNVLSLESAAGVAYELRLTDSGLELEKIESKTDDTPTFGNIEITLIGGYQTSLALVKNTVSS